MAASPLQLVPGSEDVDAWPALTVLSDPKGGLTVNEALAQADRFEAPQGPYANLGMRTGAVWLRLPVHASAGAPQQWLLDINYPSLDRIDVFVVTQGQAARHAVLGDHLAFAERVMQTRPHTMPIELAAGRDHEILLRVETSSTMIVPVRLMQAGAFQAREDRFRLVQGLLAGIGLCLAFYSLAHCFTLRESMFVYYALSIAGSTAFFFGVNGLGAQHFWPTHPYFNDHLVPMAALITSGGSLMFINRALWVDDMSRRTSQLMQVGAAVSVGCLAVYAAGLVSYRVATTVANAIGLLGLVLVVPLAWMRSRRGDRAAGYVFLGWAVYAVGVVSITALLRGWAGVSAFTLYGYQAASIFEMLMWLLVLGVRMHETREFAERANRERDVLRSMAHTDVLTGLPNRRGLQLELEAVLSRPEPDPALALYLLDLDGFKHVNDTMGHDVGDELLVAVGQRLKESMRARDVVARLGGDEFVIMAPDLGNDADARRLGEKLIDRFNAPFLVSGGRECRVGLTIGYALAPLDARNAAGLLRCADGAMYQGKQAGKHCLRRGKSTPSLQAA